MEEMVPISEAARQLGVLRSTVRRRIVRGEMEATRIHEKLWLVPQREVDRWKPLGKLTPGPKPRIDARHREELQGNEEQL